MVILSAAKNLALGLAGNKPGFFAALRMTGEGTEVLTY